MSKKVLSACALFLAGASASYAGPMGDVKKPLPLFIPFAAAEAMYTWPDVAGFNIGVVGIGTAHSSNDNQGWGGRGAVGALHPMTERWAGSAEVGWGYYGSVNMKPQVSLAPGVQVTHVGTGFNMKAEQYGFDVLAGIHYMQPKYDLFFKAGALIQNLRVRLAADPTILFQNNTQGLAEAFPGTYQLGTTIVNALPEIKLGGGYHINKEWLATVSWMHAFGSTLSFDAPALRNDPATIGAVAAQISSPTLNTILFGLEYRFS
ncbi:MAG: hypothetical protein K0U37_04985 [Gammaproteobacteria bacterium]|nr:hypothetical protein [Gammaproteobacteria bacterium]